MIFDPAFEPWILASASPRRRDILQRLGLSFEVIPACVTEILDPRETPSENAERLACLKARSVAATLTQGTVIGCDTIVAVGSRILGKPASTTESREILAFLSGKVQEVISGLCVIPLGKAHGSQKVERVGHAVTKVYTRPMSEQEIDDYVATGEGIGKAGAYAIQETGDRFVDRLEGSFDNVVGFPTELFSSYVANLIQEC